MSAKVITGSPNIASLDFNVLADLCEGVFTADLDSTIWIGSGASNVLGASFKVTNPLGVIVKNYPTSGYDIYPPMTEDVEVNVPTQASNYQYGTYTFEVSITDSDSTIYTLTKSVKICAPDSKNKTRNYGSLSATLDGNCVTGRVVVIADTPPNYQGFTTDSQVNDFLLKYPTVSEVVPLETTQNNFSVQLYEGEYQFSGTICAHYSLGDNVTANVNYRVKRFKTIRCLLDMACVAARLSELQFQISQDCTDAEKIATQATIINALLLITVINGRATTGLDPSDAIGELETVLGCVCSCNCADGTPIIPLNPTGDFSVEGCNVSVDTAGLTTIYTIENYAYYVDFVPNGGVITISSQTLADCTKTQILTFNIGTAYTQIKAQINSTNEYNFWASVINRAWNTLDLSCIGTPLQWVNWTFAQRSQWLFDRFCGAGICNAVIVNNETEADANDVVLTWENTSDVYEVAVYMDDILVGTVLNPTSTFTIVGAADGNDHEYVLVSKCTNGSQGAVLRGEFTYFGCPAIASVSVSSANITDAECPYDLTALVNSLPSGIIAEWHNLNNTNASSFVPDPTNATGGIYFVFGKNTEGCYSAFGTQVILTCSSETACTAPQNLIVAAITGDFRVRFSGAAFPPPANSYTVKRRLTADPDVSGSYTTIGTPTWNAGANAWEILDTTGIDNTLYTYRAISNCASSAPYIDYIFANITCPTVTLTPSDTTMGYSFTGVGGGVDKYEVRIYDSTGVTLIHTDTKTPAFATPITGTFIYLDEGTTYLVSLKIFIGTYSSVCGNTSGTTDEQNTITGDTNMSMDTPSFSGTIEVTSPGGGTLRLANFSTCGIADAQITISGGVGTIDNDISNGLSNQHQSVDTVIPVGSYTYTGTLTTSCTSFANIFFI